MSVKFTMLNKIFISLLILCTIGCSNDEYERKIAYQQDNSKQIIISGLDQKYVYIDYQYAFDVMVKELKKHISLANSRLYVPNSVNSHYLKNALIANGAFICPKEYIVDCKIVNFSIGQKDKNDLDSSLISQSNISLMIDKLTISSEFISYNYKTYQNSLFSIYEMENES